MSPLVCCNMMHASSHYHFLHNHSTKTCDFRGHFQSLQVAQINNRFEILEYYVLVIMLAIKGMFVEYSDVLFPILYYC